MISVSKLRCFKSAKKLGGVFIFRLQCHPSTSLLVLITQLKIIFTLHFNVLFCIQHLQIITLLLTSFTQKKNRHLLKYVNLFGLGQILSQKCFLHNLLQEYDFNIFHYLCCQLHVTLQFQYYHQLVYVFLQGFPFLLVHLGLIFLVLFVLVTFKFPDRIHIGILLSLNKICEKKNYNNTIYNYHNDVFPS